jgi:hypothetical protein
VRVGMGLRDGNGDGGGYWNGLGHLSGRCCSSRYAMLGRGFDSLGQVLCMYGGLTDEQE